MLGPLDLLLGIRFIKPVHCLAEASGLRIVDPQCFDRSLVSVFTSRIIYQSPVIFMRRVAFLLYASYVENGDEVVLL